jgi:hypothetical protein
MERVKFETDMQVDFVTDNKISPISLQTRPKSLDPEKEIIPQRASGLSHLSLLCQRLHVRLGGPTGGPSRSMRGEV